MVESRVNYSLADELDCIFMSSTLPLAERDVSWDEQSAERAVLAILKKSNEGFKLNDNPRGVIDIVFGDNNVPIVEVKFSTKSTHTVHASAGQIAHGCFVLVSGKGSGLAEMRLYTKHGASIYLAPRSIGRTLVRLFHKYLV